MSYLVRIYATYKPRLNFEMLFVPGDTASLLWVNESYVCLEADQIYYIIVGMK